jgi:hypothetical protein
MGEFNLKINWNRQYRLIAKRADFCFTFLKKNQFLIIVIVASLVLRIFWLRANVLLDEGNAGYVSMLWLRGVLPYTPQSLMDAKGPFYYLLYLFSTLSNEPLICIRTINNLLYVVSVVTIFLLVKDWYGKKIGFVSTILYMIFMNAPALEGQFAIALDMSLPFVLLSIYFCNSYIKNEKKILLLLSGITISLVLLIQPDQFIFFLLLPFMILMNRKGAVKRILKDLSTLVIGTILPIFVVMIYYLYEGEFSSLIGMWVRLFAFNLPASRTFVSQLPSAWSALTFIEALPLILLSILGGKILITRRPKSSQFVALWAGLSLMTIAAKGSILGHNLLSIVLPASILSGLALGLILANIKHKSKRRTWAIFTLVLLILSFAPSLYFQAMQYPDIGLKYGFLSWPSPLAYDEATSLSNYLKSHTTSGKLLIHGASNELYWLTGFTAPAGIYLDTTRVGRLEDGATIPTDEYEKLVTKVKNGEFDYIVRASWAPEDALTQSIRQSHVTVLGDGRVFDIKYRLLKTLRNIEVYEKHETTYETVIQTIIPNEYDFWKAGALEQGQVSIPILSNVGDISKSNESLKIVVEAGDRLAPFIYHIYEEYQDWSEYNFVSFQWYGQNSGQRVLIILWTPDLENWAVGCSITEDWFGWKQIIVPLEEFNALKGTYDLTRVKCVQIWFGNNTQGTWYLDQVSLLSARAHN